MFFELIAAICAAFAAAGIVLIVNRLTGGRLPKWAMPVAAGVAMLAFGIWSEYSWFDRQTADFPEGVEITTKREANSALRPWTLISPIVNGFAAVDLASVRSNESAPDQRMANMLYYARWSPPRSVLLVFDCAEARMAPIIDTVKYDDNGAVSDAQWAPLPADDASLKTVCKEE